MAVAAVLVLSATAARASEVTGQWRTPIDQGVVRIEPCGADICARSVSSARLAAHPDQTDARNRDPALRGRLIRGLLLFRLRPTGEGQWGDGLIYNPNDGGSYQGTVRLDAPGRLKVTGCVVAPLCRTQTWVRLDGGP